MQSYALTVDKFLDHAAKWAADREVVTGDSGHASGRIGYAALRERSNRFSGALLTLGLRFGDRIGTLAWNTQHHLEIYFAAMGVGLVCHTLNPRLSAAHLAQMINEAEDRVLAVTSNLVPLLLELAPLCPGLEHIVLLDSETEPFGLGENPARIWNYESLLESRGTPTTWGVFDENTPAGLCYTSGTTRQAEGRALYQHFGSNYLHTLRQLQADAFALTRADTTLIAVPMFHANGWGSRLCCTRGGQRNWCCRDGIRRRGAGDSDARDEEGDRRRGASYRPSGSACSTISTRPAAICRI